VAVADFNGDGNLDVAVTGIVGNNVSVRLGNGDGTVMITPRYGAGGVAAGVADLNADGIPDLVTVSGGTVSVYLGNGDGTFQSAVNYDVGHGATSVAVADVNGDGIPDLIVANRDVRECNPRFGCTDYPGGINVLLGNGDGTFQAPLEFGSFDARSVEVGDFNNDGILDLVVMKSDLTNPTVRTMSVLLGNGDGTFQSSADVTLTPGPFIVKVGDLNGDGNADIVFTNNDPTRNLSVMLGNGDGTFQPAVNYSIPGYLGSIALNDLNGDGILDLITTAGTLGDVIVMLGNGDGTFQDAQSYGTNSVATSIAVADFNNDGKPDIAVGGYGGVKVLLGNGDGTFQTSAVSYGHTPLSYSIVAADFNGDGYADVAAAQGFLLMNRGDGSSPHGGPGRREHSHREKKDGPATRLEGAAGIIRLQTAEPRQSPIPAPSGLTAPRDTTDRNLAGDADHYFMATAEELRRPVSLGGPRDTLRAAAGRWDDLFSSDGLLREFPFPELL
jgi:hypothetical protein